MQCPTCGDYGDLVIVKVKKTGEEALVCSECDSLWTAIEAEPLGETFLDVADFLAERNLEPDWDELELVRRA
ncbi:hypothetical protein J4P02_01360 [Pseudomonas sp. NFXW11]|uniref:hypothetical protein n=1 Tax=Pseudomonas sp. NFXW11 TaxID=2819531 RepID=UPI003CEF627C